MRRLKGGLKRPGLDTLAFIPWWAGRLGLDCGNHEAEEYTVLTLQDETVGQTVAVSSLVSGHDSDSARIAECEMEIANCMATGQLNL